MSHSVCRLAVTLSLVVGLAGCTAPITKQAEAVRPNIVLVLADDLGWRDVGYAGATFYETPHIDRLAADGMIFERAYTCGPNCAPTRASLLSGMYGPRHHIYTPGRLSKGPLRHMRLRVPARQAKQPVAFPPSVAALDASVVSFAEVLNDVGYVTAHFGKWHLGPDPQGFQVSSSDGMPGKRARHYGNIDVAEQLTDASLRFIEQNKDRPFLLYLAHWDVHTPIRARPAVVAKYRTKLQEVGRDAAEGDTNPTYAAMIDAVDTSVGRLRARLQALGLAENTLFVFSSDNGGLPQVSTNRPLHGGKGSLFEGGIRVPMCVSWPGQVAAGTRCAVPVTSVDVLPTMAAVAGAPLPTSQPVDGRSLVPLFRGRNESFGERSIFWFYPLYLSGGRGNKVLPIFGTDQMFWRGVPAAAIVRGNWKLVRYFEDDSVVLFDLQNDISESRDESRNQPERARALRQQLDKWLAETQAPIPTERNPAFRGG